MKRALVDTVALNTRSKRPRLFPPINNTRSLCWISATKTHNYLLNNTLCDWLDLYGKNERTFSSSKFQESSETFTDFLMKKGVEFEEELVKFLSRSHSVVTVSKYYNMEKVKDTIKCMKQGVPIIHSAPIFNKRNKTYGIIDLLVRSDYFSNIFAKSPIEEDKNISAKNLGQNVPYHYRVIDIKYSSLNLTCDGEHLLNSGRVPAYKSQVCVYNDALANIQGYKPPCAYILGRRWNYTSKGNTYSGISCIDRLGIVNFVDRDKKIVDLTKKALSWYRNVSKNGVHWDLNPPSRKELYPNMNVDSIYWYRAKEEIAQELGEITMLWQCGIRNREKAFENGVRSWRDRNCNSEILGVGKSYSPVVNKLIEINRDSNEKILPKVIENNIGEWKNTTCDDLFVDFETFSDICQSFDDLPRQNKLHMIFMIGVGYIENNEWKYLNFTCEKNTLEEEYRIMDEFSKFVNSRRNPKLFYWHAEKNFWNKSSDIQFEKVLYTERKRNNIINNWDLEDEWIDMATIFRKEPVVIKGCFSYGLKPLSKAMREHNMITTKLESECCSGLMAMIKAWNCYKNKLDPLDAPVMKDILTYNEFDCKVMWDMITYLRKNHM